MTTTEELAPPHAETAEWVDPTDDDVRRREAKKIRGFRRTWVIDTMHARAPRDVTSDHVKAARGLLRDYEIGLCGASSGAAAMDRVDGGSSNDGITQAAIDAAKKYREAVTVLGASACAVLLPVVISNWSIQELATSIGRTGTEGRLAGRLFAALDRLHEHYQPTKPDGGVVYHPIHGDIEGLPAERLGRWRT